MNFLNSMNLGGGAAGASGKSVKLFAGLRDELTKLQPVLDKIVQSTQKMAENLTKAKGASSLGFTGGGSTTSLGFIDDSGGGMSFRSFAQGMAKVTAVGMTAAAQAIDLNQFAESSISRSRIGFFSGQGSAAAGMSFQNMMNRGTGIDPMDAARAAMAGTSMGLNPALPGYGTVAAGAATFSNLVPGAGLAGGMQAMAALNQAPNVNRLRMIGIQVRDPATGTMRSPEAIANDLWNKLNTQKTGSAQISKRDIAISLQSGNSLDMMLNQYFGNDPVLRQGVVTALMQKAGGGGLSREELIQSGALPELAASTGERNAAAYGAINAYTGDVEEGMMGANRIIADAANTLRDAADTFGGAVGVFAGAMQLSGGGNGAFGTLGGAALGGLANFGGSFLGTRGLKGMGGLFKGGKLGSAMGNIGKVAGTAGRAIPLVGGAASVIGGGFDQYSNAQNEEGFDWLSALLATGGGALAGFMLGGPAGALIGGAAGLGSSIAGYHMGGGTSIFGEGDGGNEYNAYGAMTAEEGAGARSSGTYNPLEELSVNAVWMKKRDYLIDGKPPANPYHTGIDYGAAENSTVYAVKDGVVYKTRDNGSKGFGKSIAIKHPDGYTTFYAHLNAHGVKAGDVVKAGDPIGLSGNTGLSSGPHLHFEVRRNADDQSTHVDPVAYIAGSATPTKAADFKAESASSGSEAASASAGLLGDLSSGAVLLPGLSGAPSPGGEGDGGGFSNTTNYGGVTVNINVPKGTNVNEQSLAREIKRVLSDQDMLRKAVSR